MALLRVQNRGAVFAGGVIVTSARYEATDTIHNENIGRLGGGAIKIVGGRVRLKRCKVNNNVARYGGGFDIVKQEDLAAEYTQIIVEDSEIMGNVVQETGAGFHLDAHDELIFRRVKIGNNTGERQYALFVVIHLSTS
jgi:hypothetical protein